jgi:hypothetical protein
MPRSNRIPAPIVPVTLLSMVTFARATRCIRPITVILGPSKAAKTVNCISVAGTTGGCGTGGTLPGVLRRFFQLWDRKFRKNNLSIPQLTKLAKNKKTVGLMDLFKTIFFVFMGFYYLLRPVTV